MTKNPEGAKIFSFIHLGSCALKPKTKIIRKNDFSVLLDAKELLEKTKEDALKYKEDVILEGEELKSQAEQDGYKKGFESFIEKMAELEEAIKNAEKMFLDNTLPIALKAARKIVGKEIELNKEVVVDIIINSLKDVAQHKRVLIYVSPKDFELVEKKRPDLKNVFENLETLSIRAREDIKQGGCMIETEGGIINAQLENLWANLEKAFKRVLETKKK